MVFNGKLVVTGNIYVCDKATSKCYRVCQDGDTQPWCDDSSCSPKTIGTCVLSGAYHNGSSGVCAPGYHYKGSCVYRCNNGTWEEVVNTCTPCASSLSCRARSSLGQSCCTKKSTCEWSDWSCHNIGSCGGMIQVINNCLVGSGYTYLKTSNGDTERGRCTANYAGKCSYRCNHGTWEEVSNSCSPIGCRKKDVSIDSNGTLSFIFFLKGSIGFVTPGGRRKPISGGLFGGRRFFTYCRLLDNATHGQEVTGSCGGRIKGIYKPIVKGSCSARCSEGRLALDYRCQVCLSSDECSQILGQTEVEISSPLDPPCPAKTIKNCSLSKGRTGEDIIGSCTSGYTGSCAYYCDRGFLDSVFFVGFLCAQNL